MEELKRCPFCGGEAKLISNRIEYEDVHAVRCQKCGASIGFNVQEFGEYRPGYVFKDNAIAAWNRRVTQNIGKKECCEQKEES